VYKKKGPLFLLPTHKEPEGEPSIYYERATQEDEEKKGKRTYQREKRELCRERVSAAK